MNCCFFNDIDSLGGGERWVLRACHYMRSLGHRVCLICPRDSGLHLAGQQQGIEVFAYIVDGAFGQLPDREVCQFLLQTRPDILYCTVIGRFCEVRWLQELLNSLRRESCGPGSMVILKTGLPPVEHLSPEYYGAGANSAVRRLHVVSASIKEAFFHWQPQMNNGFIEVFYEGTDRQVFDKDRHNVSDSRRLFGLAPDLLIISCIARLDGIKGQSVLLRSIPHIVGKHPDVMFLFAGEGQDRDLLEELIEDLGISRWVRLMGNIDCVTDLLAVTDILCHPSLNEGTPNAIIEAMMMSVPIVASDLPGIKEIIENGKTGILVRPNDVGCLTGALLQTLDDRAGRTTMARQANIAVSSSRFDFTANMDRLLSRLAEELRAWQKAPHLPTAPKDLQRHGSIAVLFIMHEIRLGGEETELGILSRYLDRQRFNMSVLSCYPSREQAPVLQRFRYYDVRVDTTCYNFPDEEDKINYIVDLIKARDIGIVVACQDTRLVYEVFKRLSPNECRLIEHGGVIEDVSRIPKHLTARYVGVSTSITRAAAARMRTAEDAVFIPSMVDTDEYVDPHWAEARAMTKEYLHKTILAPFGYGEDVCVIVFVGRLDPKKRAEDLVQAARILEADCPEAFFLIIGGEDSFVPEYGRQLISEASDLVARGRLAFTGTRDDVPGLLTASDILVMPSTGEGMAHVINEAGAAGLAVVATYDGAAAEQLEDGRCGLLVPQRNVDELASTLSRLIKDKALRRQLGRRLKEKVDIGYNARVVINQWHALFEDVAAELNKPPRYDLASQEGSFENMPIDA
jgi:glycosyltransferase involved in cell wall biosynthesis